MSYHLRRWSLSKTCGQGVFVRYEDGRKACFLALRPDGGRWVWHPEEPPLTRSYHGKITEITKEEAAMILFSCKERR